MVTALLWALIGGTILGLLGKLFAPGDTDRVPLWLTIVCGIVGGLVGNYLYGLFFDPQTRGVDWWRHAWQVVVAALLVGLAASASGRQRV